MRTRVVLIVLALATVALAAGQAPRPFTWTLERDDAGSGKWTIDCTFQDRRCTTDFDGGVPSPMQCPAGNTCNGALIPVDAP